MLLVVWRLLCWAVVVVVYVGFWCVLFVVCCLFVAGCRFVVLGAQCMKAACLRLLLFVVCCCGCALLIDVCRFRYSVVRCCLLFVFDDVFFVFVQCKTLVGDCCLLLLRLVRCGLTIICYVLCAIVCLCC